MKVINGVIGCTDKIDIIHERKGKVIYDSRKTSFFKKWLRRITNLKMIHFISFSGNKHVIVIFGRNRMIIKDMDKNKTNFRRN